MLNWLKAFKSTKNLQLKLKKKLNKVNGKSFQNLQDLNNHLAPNWAKYWSKVFLIYVQNWSEK